MKKSVIKRRKRVVPANNEPESNHQLLNSFAVSPSPTPQQLDSEPHLRPRMLSTIESRSPLDLRPTPQHLDSPELRNKQRVSSNMDPNSPLNLDLRQRNRPVDHHNQYEPPPPIGVDFTGYELDQRHPQSQQQHLPPISNLDASRMPSESEAQYKLSPLPGASSRKRSHSNTEKSSPSPSENTRRLSSITTILNQPQQSSAVEEMPIDPNLSTLPPQLQQHRHSTPLPQPQHYQLPPPRQSTSSDPGSWDLNEKKAKLRREAEVIREALKAKERELDELERQV